MKCNPIYLESVSDTGRMLERIESVAGDVKDEHWLQELVFARPELLPIDEFDSTIGTLIPIGREVSNPSGSIDNLYVSTNGILIIAETKLWKNPEKHREVVAQIIDYAKELSNWAYDDLDDAIKKSSRSRDTAKSLEQIVRPVLDKEGLDFTEFQEQLLNNIKHGRFLLFIVRDKISPNVALLSKAIHGAPGLEFQFGLIEIRLHVMEAGKEWPLIVIPDIVGKTVEEPRAIVKVQYEQEKPTVDVEVPSDESIKRAKGKVTLDSLENEIPEDLQPTFKRWIKIWQDKGYPISYRTVGVGLHILTGGKRRSFFEIYPNCVALRNEKYLDYINATEEQYREYLEELKGIPKAMSVVSEGKRMVYFDGITADEFDTILKANVNFADKVTD